MRRANYGGMMDENVLGEIVMESKEVKKGTEEGTVKDKESLSKMIEISEEVFVDPKSISFEIDGVKFDVYSTNRLAMDNYETRDKIVSFVVKKFSFMNPIQVGFPELDFVDLKDEKRKDGFIFKATYKFRPGYR
ncbi:MAG: hypothetical protein QW727_03850 [Candidatus Pacearchaeota archaeon]